jgi:1-aminocyclopropane-1-carboxylate deaminase/D-cysteine desulfhydrase-like pyridoxal-dependent ACC family enzyme
VSIAIRTTEPAIATELPLIRRFPALAAVPRARLGDFPSPVEQLDGFRDVDALWIKRDDLDAPDVGGNKVRALEFLLGRVREGDTVVTIGGEGSTHVLSTAVHASRLGARTVAFRWPHDMHPVATQVGARAALACAEVTSSSNIAVAVGRAWLRRARGGVHYLPLGGSAPLGVLGQVSAALELCEQVKAGALPAPRRVVVPMGTGGTAAGLALGFAIAGVDTAVVAARAGPRLGSNRARVHALIMETTRLIERYTGRRLPGVRSDRIQVAHEAYGGAYGRPYPAAESAAEMLRELRGVRLDSTYSAKAFAVALDVARRHSEPTVFWLTFDARWLSDAAFTPEGS